ncbi:hypothetical protein DFJ58DRAFT_842243 [Suillus subalutaceus]|uniref:uncharacterized protein n=1 Tax=Suillus subalutaceus TaxID=48586 RepID=UPI001B86DAC5|nr:uncharacterized protein DFJ58DRAFT_842243 [Suillus subalutaceus]KAG1851043.1 hypothetical protein DFJ58DRAFT_842243 [Suillus subalutaceus]
MPMVPCPCPALCVSLSLTCLPNADGAMAMFRFQNSILMDWMSGNPPSSSQVKSFNATLHIATLTRISERGKKKVSRAYGMAFQGCQRVAEHVTAGWFGEQPRLP